MHCIGVFYYLYLPPMVAPSVIRFGDSASWFSEVLRFVGRKIRGLFIFLVKIVNGLARYWNAQYICINKTDKEHDNATANSSNNT